MRFYVRLTAALMILLILLPACWWGQEEEEGREMVHISARATAPLEGTYIYVYREDMDLYGPALTTAGPAGPDGRVDLDLKPGRYIFVARKRASGEDTGPVVSGDYRGDPLGPIEIKAGVPLDLRFFLEKKVGETKTLPFREEGEIRTGLTGRIADSEGKPVAGARVHVYTYVQMSERPKYVSNETGPDGVFVVLLPEGGTYYLAARDRFGGPPKLGDLYGRYDDGTIDPSAVVVQDGEVLEGVDITVHRVW
jgi:hypothetical protein